LEIFYYLFHQNQLITKKQTKNNQNFIKREKVKKRERWFERRKVKRKGKAVIFHVRIIKTSIHGT
jgi:hypothetical protein